MGRTRTQLQKSRDAEYHRRSWRATVLHPKKRRTKEQNLKYNTIRRAKKAPQINEIQLESNPTDNLIEEETYVATKLFNNDTIYFTNSGVNRRETASAAEVNSHAEPANILPPEVEPDPTAWLEHLDDPVLVDDRNEGPIMYGFFFENLFE